MQRIHKKLSVLQLCASAWIMAVIVFTLCLPYLTSQTALAQSGGTRNLPDSNNEPTIEQPRAPIIPVDHESLILPHSATDAAAETLFFEIRIPMITQMVVAMTAAASFLFIIIGGIQMLTAYGDSEKVEKGKKTMTYAIVGLVIAILSYAIVSIISFVDVAAAQNTPPNFQDASEAANPLIPPRDFPDRQTESSKIELVQNLPSESWQTVLGSIIRIILGITGSLTLIAMTTSGVLMLLAQGDEDKIHKAKDILLWSLVALVIIAVSYGLVVGVTNLQFFS